MKKILIIGGTGTISTPITKILSNKEDVQLFILNRGQHPQVLKQSITYLKGDINHFEEIQTLLDNYQFDVVCNFIIFSREQAEINWKLFNGKTKQFIHISTAAVYDHENHCVLDENTPMGNRYSEYGRNKESVENYFNTLYREKNFPVTIVRPSQTYSRDRIPLSVKGKNCWSVIDRMLKGKQVIVHGDGQSIWASTHADDFARAFIGLINNKKTIGETYQIVNENPHTWDMIYQTLADLLGVSYKPVYIPSSLLKNSQKYDLLTAFMGDKQYSCLFDTSKIKQAVPDLKWTIDYKTGLKMYLDYMEQHPESKQTDDEFDEWCDDLIKKYLELSRKLTAIL